MLCATSTKTVVVAWRWKKRMLKKEEKGRKTETKGRHVSKQLLRLNAITAHKQAAAKRCILQNFNN